MVVERHRVRYIARLVQTLANKTWVAVPYYAKNLPGRANDNAACASELDLHPGLSLSPLFLKAKGRFRGSEGSSTTEMLCR